MDKIESLTNTLQNITLYDIKSMYNQAKNVVLNVSEMEAKVREATNDDPWGASSTLMQEIAQGTFHFQYFNEIMPSIYSRFMEKEARQWRQIYKALQLLEYLIKHGSERVVDDARSHISTLKMLRNFHYIDDKGKDEGINVRNRARELVELLSDVEKIRAERRKAKVNKNKYVGVGSDGFSGGMSFETSGGRYGGFGSDSLGGGSSSYGNYSNGGGSSSRGGGSSSFSDSRRPYEEYNAGDDEISHSSTPIRSSSVRVPVRKATAPPPPPHPAPVEDLLGGFDDDAFKAPVPSVALGANKALPMVSNSTVSLDDDDFADFQVAPVSAALPVQTVPAPAQNTIKKPNLMEMLNSTSTQPSVNPSFVQSQQLPTYGMGMPGHRQNSSVSQLSFGTSVIPQSQQHSFVGGASGPIRPTPMNSVAAPTKPAPTPAKGNFDDLWSMSLGNSAVNKTASAPGAGKSIKDLEKEKAMAGLWGGQKKPPVGTAQPTFGNFGNGAPPSSSSGGDDLLL
ncbi:hypothetical protein NLJ89_g14 [Agrocybe chaxingu]|uniref:ENTH domain-containing protein n=1 Tax=Agrocybe chaxingu TaxID=84603 RepID=A0A9W8N2S7_9AGAR|nr:hypothetical protein NLJ89_g14 [Agrocybe chaxingu]